MPSDQKDCPFCGATQQMEGGNGFWDLAVQPDAPKLMGKQSRKEKHVFALTVLCGVFCFISFVLLIGNIIVVRSATNKWNNMASPQQNGPSVSAEDQFSIQDHENGEYEEDDSAASAASNEGIDDERDDSDSGDDILPAKRASPDEKITDGEKNYADS